MNLLENCGGVLGKIWVFLFHGAGITIMFLRDESVNLTSLQASSPGGPGGGVKNEPEHTIADRDKTLPEFKTLPRIQNTSENPEVFWCRVMCFGFWEVF